MASGAKQPESYVWLSSADGTLHIMCGVGKGGHHVGGGHLGCHVSGSTHIVL